MKTLELTDATASLADYARSLDHEPVVVTTDGKPVAALLRLENVDWEILSLSTNPDFIALIERSRRRQQEEGGISSDEMRRRLGLQK